MSVPTVTVYIEDGHAHIINKTGHGRIPASEVADLFTQADHSPSEFARWEDGRLYHRDNLRSALKMLAKLAALADRCTFADQAPTWTPITDVDEARRIASEWQSSGTIGAVLAAFASGVKVDRWRLHDDARATQQESPGMPLSDWADLDRLRDWAKVADDPLLTGPAGNIRVITNHHRLPEVEGWETTPEERECLDYVNWAAVEDGSASFTGVRYRGWLYDLGDTEGPPSGQLAEQGWTSYRSDSFFSGVVFRQEQVDGEWVVMAGRYCA